MTSGDWGYIEEVTNATSLEKCEVEARQLENLARREIVSDKEIKNKILSVSVQCKKLQGMAALSKE